MHARSSLAALVLVSALLAPALARAQLSVAQPATTTLTVVGERDDLRLHRYLGTHHVMQWSVFGPAASPRDDFEALCTAPCVLQVPVDLYHFGVSHGFGQAYRGGETMRIDRPTTVRISYEDRTALRVAGWITFVGGLVAAVALLVAPIVTGSLDDLGPWALAASISGVVGMAVGIPLVALTDHAGVEVMDDREE